MQAARRAVNTRAMATAHIGGDDVAKPGPKPRPVEERFWSKVDRCRPDECWPWIGGTHSAGYGLINYHGQMTGAHRVSWELHYGPIPDGLWVLHHCDNPPCVNPSHLFLGTHDDNMADMVAKGRGGSWGEHKTHCPQGHPYDEANTLISGGRRECRTCKRARYRDWETPERARRRNRQFYARHRERLAAAARERRARKQAERS